MAYEDDHPNASLYELDSWEDFGHYDPALQNDWALAVLHEHIYDEDLAGDLRANMFEAIEAYLMETYGYDFDEIFDWDDFREWYDA